MKCLAHRCLPLFALCAVSAQALGQAPAESSLTAFERYISAAEQDIPNRASDRPVGSNRISAVQRREETADTIREYQEIIEKRTYELSKLVLMDNALGAVYPGALLWAAKVRAGQLHALEQLPGRPPVTVTLTGMKDFIPASLTGGLAVTSEPAPAGQPDVRRVSFAHNGTFSDFTEKARPLFSLNVPTGVRLAANSKVSTSLNDALLSIGLSAKYWGGSLAASLSRATHTEQTVALLTVDQVYYSAVADAPPLGGYLSDEFVQNNPAIASRLADGAAQGGEVVYVRKVDYGRRVLVSLTTNTGTEEFKDALNAAVHAIGTNFTGNFSDRTRQAWNAVEGNILIIGGKYPAGVDKVFSGNLDGFLSTMKAVMLKENTDYDPATGAVPVSFELAYARDNAPMQVYETTDFAGRIPGPVQSRVTKTYPIHTTGQDAAVKGGDSEIGSDDWTIVRVEKQNLRLSDDRRTVYFDLRWSAIEADSHGHPNDTVITSMKTFAFPMPNRVKEFISPLSANVKKKAYADEVHNAVPFPNCGLLSNIRVRFDHPHNHDETIQDLRADLEFSLWLEQ